MCTVYKCTAFVHNKHSMLFVVRSLDAQYMYSSHVYCNCTQQALYAVCGEVRGRPACVQLTTVLHLYTTGTLCCLWWGQGTPSMCTRYQRDNILLYYTKYWNSAAYPQLWTGKSQICLAPSAHKNNHQKMYWGMWQNHGMPSQFQSKLLESVHDYI